MTDVVMPQMGESIVEGTLTKWLKKAGDTVERDEPLFEISTDKVDTEIPAPAAGVLAEVLVQEGQTVGVNAIVGRINEGGEAAPAVAAPKEEPTEAVRHETQVARMEAPPAAAPKETPVAAAPSAEPQEAPATKEPSGPLSPLVRKMARENNVDLSLRRTMSNRS
jgi:2-oxoglutarate dehydrogenase E2 component (dihydrolipoamide succinyltransferase)